MIKKIVIVGGGFAGWYTACALQYQLADINITLIDSSKFGTIGVGEATPFDGVGSFERMIGLDDQQFVRRTGSIYKYGVRAYDFYQNSSADHWGKIHNLKLSSLTKFFQKFEHRDSYSAGTRKENDRGLLLTWLTLNQNKNKTVNDMMLDVSEQYHFLTNPLAPYDRDNQSILERDGLAYHLDAEQSIAYIRDLVYSRDCSQFRHITSTVVDVINDDKNVTSIKLENGMLITADLFIDASGLRRVLMSKSNNTSWQDSGPETTNSAWVCPSKYLDPEKELVGASEFYGEDYGWRFKIRLYHRIGNGYIFNSRLVDAEVPRQKLLDVVKGTQLNDPKLIQWDPGYYRKPWQGNIVPVGMAAIFVDPYDAPTLSAHNSSLEDIVDIIKNNIQNPQEHYNQMRDFTNEERHWRMNLPFGLSKKSGPFWDQYREKAHNEDFNTVLKDIILENRADIDSRLKWYWPYIYLRIAVGTNVDLTQWDFPKLTNAESEIAQAFFTYNRQRNNYIKETYWPNYYQWLKANRFGGASHLEILQELNPQLAKNA